MARRREIRRLVDHRALRMPWVSVVAAAQQLAKLRPRLERRQRCVRRDEALAVAHERGQFLLLGLINRHVAMPEEEDRVGHRQAWTAARRLAGGALRLIRNDV